MKKVISVLALLCLLVTMFTACTPENSSSSSVEESDNMVSPSEEDLKEALERALQSKASVIVRNEAGAYDVLVIFSLFETPDEVTKEFFDGANAVTSVIARTREEKKST